MGRRTSLYLSDDLAAAVARTELTLAELVRRGVCASLADRVVVPADAPQHRHCQQCGAMVDEVPQ